MKNLAITILFLTFVSSMSYAQEAKVIRLDELQKFIKAPSEKIKVINFWATWCAPCIKELPYFEQLHKERQDVKVTLVSMDMDLDPNPAKVHTFIARKDILSQVLILN